MHNNITFQLMNVVLIEYGTEYYGQNRIMRFDLDPNTTTLFTTNAFALYQISPSICILFTSTNIYEKNDCLIYILQKWMPKDFTNMFSMDYNQIFSGRQPNLKEITTRKELRLADSVMIFFTKALECSSL